MDSIQYLSGFNNHFSTEAAPGALPQGQNAPQHPPLGLYAEQLSGSAFTLQPRAQNLRSWLYRIRPSVCHTEYQRYAHASMHGAPFNTTSTNPTQLRWHPIDYPNTPIHFIDSLITWMGHGDARMHQGAAIHLYACTKNMEDDFFYNADGELLIVPQEGGLLCQTEMGTLEVNPKDIMVIPRGIKFQIALLHKRARGYVLENYAAPLSLPELGPIGANGLASPRDFLYPSAAYHVRNKTCRLICKFLNHFYYCETPDTPLDVVAWHGNYAPYKYDLTRFNTINSVSFDHPDPSIFTVLTSQSNTPGVANVDFVIFPERWMVAEHTFRPPYYHRNIMSEYMGLIWGQYDAKPDSFKPGGGSLHNMMTPHGPDKAAFENARQQQLAPEKYQNTLAFMFESKLPWQPTKQALSVPTLDEHYLDAWAALTPLFKGC